MQSTTADFKKILQRAGYKATPGREGLLQVLWHEDKPLTVLEIQKRLKPVLNEVTLYRALEAFAESGIIRRVDLGHGHAHYEMEKQHHHHVVCSTCGVVEDIQDPALERAVKKLEKSSRRFKSIYSHNLEFFGSCTRCA